MDRINHVKIRTPHPEIVDAFLRQVCEIPDGWPLGAGSTAAPARRAARVRAARSTSPTMTGDPDADGSGPGGFITGDETSRQFQIFGSPTPRIWAICIGTRHIERAHERCLARGIPATPILVADWNERDNIRNFFCLVDGLTFEVIRVEPKPA